MNYESIEQKSLALHSEERGDLSLLLLDSLDGLSDEEIDGGKAETSIQQAEDLKKLANWRRELIPNWRKPRCHCPSKNGINWRLY